VEKKWEITAVNLILTTCKYFSTIFAQSFEWKMSELCNFSTRGKKFSIAKLFAKAAWISVIEMCNRRLEIVAFPLF